MSLKTDKQNIALYIICNNTQSLGKKIDSKEGITI